MVEAYELLVEKLREIEGGLVHKNKGESDITTSCGIYRGAHPNAGVFTYIDQLAMAIGISKPSSQWTRVELDAINNHIDRDIENSYSVEFYKDYFSKVVDINKLPNELIWPFYNIYVNGNKLAGKALQYSCNLMLKKYPKLFNPSGDKNELNVDGLIGNGTRSLLYSISEIVKFLPQGDVYGEIWKQYFLQRCKTEYVMIGTTDVSKTGTDKDIKFLRGWINRCDALLEETL